MTNQASSDRKIRREAGLVDGAGFQRKLNQISEFSREIQSMISPLQASAGLGGACLVCMGGDLLTAMCTNNPKTKLEALKRVVMLMDAVSRDKRADAALLKAESGASSKSEHSKKLTPAEEQARVEEAITMLFGDPPKKEETV